MGDVIGKINDQLSAKTLISAVKYNSFLLLFLID